MKIDDMVDILIMVLWLVVGISSTTWALGQIKNNIKDYQTTDKISIKALGDNTPEYFEMEPADIMLMSVVADSNQPYPSNIQINDNTVVNFDSDYFRSTTDSINNFWNNHVSGIANDNIKDFTLEHDGGILRWKIATQ